MSAKLATLDLLKIKVFEKKVCDVYLLSMTTPKKLSGDSNYVVDVVI